MEVYSWAKAIIVLSMQKGHLAKSGKLSADLFSRFFFL
jgi:hypothetical protein